MKQQTEIPLEGVGPPKAILAKAELILRLLEPATSLSVIGEFLKEKGLHHSAGSWGELAEKRIIPALSSSKISLTDLGNWLAEVEEFGRAHVFLFSAKNLDVQPLVRKEQIAKVCARLGISTVLQDVIVEDLPDQAKITQIREENLNGVQTWVFKIVESREERIFLDEKISGNRISREYQLERVRAVNVARLHASGFLEIRIQAHGGAANYQSDLQKIWSMCRDFIPPTVFQPFSLSKAKDNIWEERDLLKSKIRFSDSRMKNNAGTTLAAFTGADTADLFADKAATKSMSDFLGGGAHCDSSNIWFRKVDGVLTREIHVLLSGQRNEFAVTANCRRSEYEYVLNELRANSK